MRISTWIIVIAIVIAVVLVDGLTSSTFSAHIEWRVPQVPTEAIVELLVLHLIESRLPRPDPSVEP